MVERVQMVEQAKRSDGALLEEAKSGQAAGFEELYRRHSPRVYSVARRMLGEDQAAEDVTQEVFLKAFRSLAQFRGEAEIGTWLHRITLNQCINQLRASSVRRSQSLDALPVADASIESVPDFDQTLNRDDLQYRIQGALDRMDPEYRVVLVLRALENKSYAEIGVSTGESEDQIRGRLHRARKAFIQLFNA